MGVNDEYTFDDIPFSSSTEMSLITADNHLGQWLSEKESWNTLKLSLAYQSEYGLFGHKSYIHETPIGSLPDEIKLELVQRLDLKTLIRPEYFR